MKEKELLKQILDDYPQFYTKDPDSNHVKYHTAVTSEFLQLKRQQFIVEMAKNIQRPVRLWKAQTFHYSYSIKYEINLPNIKRVQLFQEGITNPLQDSGILPAGTSSYNRSLGTTSSTIIPTARYYIIVEDYNENLISKGIPENDIPLGDMYDHDSALDVFGINYYVPRRIFRDGLTPDEYPFTEPTYCIDGSEPDYWYEHRIRDTMLNYNTISLPASAMIKYFGISPKIVGRWRSVARMNETFQDEKFMQSHEWNSAVFDVIVNADNVPKNLEYPDQDAIQSVVDRTFPLSKKAYVSYVLQNNIGSDSVFVESKVKSLKLPYYLNQNVVLDKDMLSGSLLADIADLMLADKYKGTVVNAHDPEDDAIVLDKYFGTVVDAHNPQDVLILGDNKVLTVIDAHDPEDVLIVKDKYIGTVIGAYDPEDVLILEDEYIGTVIDAHDPEDDAIVEDSKVLTVIDAHNPEDVSIVKDKYFGTVVDAYDPEDDVLATDIDIVSEIRLLYSEPIISDSDSGTVIDAHNPEDSAIVKDDEVLTVTGVVYGEDDVNVIDETDVNDSETILRDSPDIAHLQDSDIGTVIDAYDPEDDSIVLDGDVLIVTEAYDPEDDVLVKDIDIVSGPIGILDSEPIISDVDIGTVINAHDSEDDVIILDSDIFGGQLNDMIEGVIVSDNLIGLESDIPLDCNNVTLFNLGSYISARTYWDAVNSRVLFDTTLESLLQYPTTGVNSTLYSPPGSKAWVNPASIIDTSASTFASVVGIDNIDSSATNNPTTHSVSGTGVNWYNTVAAADESMTTYAQSNAGGWSDYLHLGGFGFNIPTNTIVTGVRMRVYGGGCTQTIEMTMEPGNGINKIKTGTMSADHSTWNNLGGTGDMWGGLSTNPADYNGNNLDVSIRINSINAWCDVKYIEVDVYYRLVSVATYTEWDLATLPNFNIPSDATITGIMFESYTQGTYTGVVGTHSVDHVLVLGDAQTYKPTRKTNSNNAWTSNTYGGSNNNLGLNLTPANLNGIKVGVAMSVPADSDYTAKLNYIRVTVYWRLTDGQYITSAVSKPSGGIWDHIDVTWYNNTSTTLLFDVLGDGDVTRLTNVVPPINISGLSDSVLKLKCKFNSLVTTANSSVLSRITFNSIKRYSF